MRSIRGKQQLITEIQGGSRRLPGSVRPAHVSEIRITCAGGAPRVAYIIDGVLPASRIRSLYSFFKGLSYRLADADRPDTAHVRHLVHVFAERDWSIAPLLPVTAFAEEFLVSQRRRARKIKRIYANFNLFGDFQFRHHDGDEWTVLAFVNERWDEDWGGELLLYPDDPRAPAVAIAPRPGRLVVFDGLIRHRGGVPSKFCLEPRISVAIKFGR